MTRRFYFLGCQHHVPIIFVKLITKLQTRIFTIGFDIIENSLNNFGHIRRIAR